MQDARPRAAIGAALFLASMLVAAPALAQVDFSGQWAVQQHEDQAERGPAAARRLTSASR